ncbi:MAG: TolC family protein [Gemmataceae bacterium]
MRRRFHGMAMKLWAASLMVVAVSYVVAADLPPIDLSTSNTLTPAKAVAIALEHNPQLAVARSQRGLAAANVIIARTYPFNPTWESAVLAANGPPSAGITNHVFNEHIVSMPIEIRGQRNERRAAACAGLSRAECEIVAAEATTAVSVIRSYNTVLYRQQKLQILEDTVRFNEQIVDRGKRLVDLNQIRPAELVLARSELASARAQIGQGRTAVAIARAEFRTSLGTTDDSFVLAGDFEQTIANLESDTLTKIALDRRADLQAQRAAIAEAEAQLRLQVADRYGNPTIGTRYEFNESSAHFIGGVVSVPLPVFNRKQGEICQKQAELARTRLELRQTELQIAQAVQAALARFREARKWADEYPAEVLPTLDKARQDLERLFAQNDQGVDVLKVLGVQSNYLKAREAYLDARYELSQAIADLAAALGDPTVAQGSPPSK